MGEGLISGVVLSIAQAAVILFTGCSVGVLKGDQCDNGQERSLRCSDCPAHHRDGPGSEEES